ncbi:methylenetetrahydrofolate reductase [NAD(P)H] [Clostridium sp. DL1XJH146]
MFIKDIFKEKKSVVSFEIFPPKKEASISTIYETIDALAYLNPDYISVTYGAGGTLNNDTVKIASYIKNQHKIEALAHLTCINSTEAEIDMVLRDLKDNNIANILALRGDVPDKFNLNLKRDFYYASDLSSYIKKKGDFSIAGACYPEGHIESSNLDEDIDNLKLKINTGVDFLITQLFFDNKFFYDYKLKMEENNIKIPIEVGIMPVINKKQIKRIVDLCGATLPRKFVTIMDKYENNKEALRDAGIAYATEQIVDLISNGVDGIHIYTMNNPFVAEKIVSNISSVVKANNIV